MRWLDFADLDFSCRTPVSVLDVHAQGAGDVKKHLTPYCHAASLQQSLDFVQAYEWVGFSPLMVDALLRGMGSFSSCQVDAAAGAAGPLYIEAQTRLPPTAQWALRMVAYRFRPAWLALVALSLACVLWQLSREAPAARRRWWGWVVCVTLLGPLGLLIYLVAVWRPARLRDAAPPPRPAQERPLQAAARQGASAAGSSIRPPGPDSSRRPG